MRALLEANGSQPSLEACVALLAANGALECTAVEARARRRQAVDALAVLPPSTARARMETYATDLLGTLPCRTAGISGNGNSFPHRRRPKRCLPSVCGRT